MIRDRWLSYDTLTPQQKAQCDAAWVEPIERLDPAEFRRLYITEWPRPVHTPADLDVLAALEERRFNRRAPWPVADTASWDRLLANQVITLVNTTGLPRLTSLGLRVLERWRSAA